MQQPNTMFPRRAASLDFGPRHARPAAGALGRPRPAPASPPPMIAASIVSLPYVAIAPRIINSGTQFATTQFPAQTSFDDSRDSVIARRASTTTVRSARRSSRRKLYTARVVFTVLFVANAMLLGAILGLLVAK